MYRPWNGHLEGVPQPHLGDLRSPWLLTTYKAWDDPPSKLGSFSQLKNYLTTASLKETPRQHSSYCQIMIGVSNHLLSIVFRFHYHSQKVIGSLGDIIMIPFLFVFLLVLESDHLQNLKIIRISSQKSRSHCDLKDIKWLQSSGEVARITRARPQHGRPFVHFRVRRSQREDYFLWGLAPARCAWSNVSNHSFQVKVVTGKSHQCWPRRPTEPSTSVLLTCKKTSLK